MDILKDIIATKKSEVAFECKNVNYNEIKNLASNAAQNNSLIKYLDEKSEDNKIALIAEVKKASPSKGLIRKDFNPVDIATVYKNCGASAISVLTDEKYFQGSKEYFNQVRQVVDLPLLRKDFIVDEFQVYQTKLMKADIILLIVAALDFSQLKDYFQLAKELNLDVLVETHDEEEFAKAMELNAKLIGINNRNLKTFEVSLDNTFKILKEFDTTGVHVVSESGIHSNSDVALLNQKGVDAVLIGEAFMKERDIEKSVTTIMGKYI